MRGLRWLFWSGILALLGCASASPRFGQSVVTPFAQEKMRKFESATLELYYPERYRDEALRVASRMSSCIAKLRELPQSNTPRSKFLVYLTPGNFNNAYVQPEALGSPQQMVLAHHMTLEFFNLLEFGESEIGDIACHESVHYVQMQQVNGFWRGINVVFNNFIQPNIFTESWFLEGLATYYEGRLGKEAGRSSSPVWHGLFESIVAARKGNLNPGDLSSQSRELVPFGGNYLVGMHFVEYLARTYGPDKLWKLVDVQGHSIFSPFWVSLRFKDVYGKSLGALFDDFSADLKAHLPNGQRPPGQRVLTSNLGYWVRMAASPRDGSVATLSNGLDDVVRLTMREPNGRIRFSEPLTRILPPRQYVAADALNVSGMSFTADGRFLYLVSNDTNANTEDEPRLWKVDTRDGNVVRIWEKMPGGLGGTVSPDGKRYVYVNVVGDVANLMELDLETDARTPLTHFTGKTSLGTPAYSPDGHTIAFSRWTGEGFDLFLLAADGSMKELTWDAALNYAPRWLDGHRLVALHDTGGRSQVQLIDLQAQTRTQLTEAPFLALDPMPIPGGRVVFLNREGAGFTLDQVSVPTQLDVAKTSPLRPSSGTQASLPPPAPPEDVVPPHVDGPYHPGEHLLLPEWHAPFAYLEPRGNGYVLGYGASLAGSDRLGLHNYAANIWYEQGQRGPNWSVGYGNYQLAPWFLTATLSRQTSGTISDVSAQVSASRTFWTSPVSFGWIGTDRSDGPFFGSGHHNRFVGPSAYTSYGAFETTPYAGGVRGAELDLNGAFYSKAFGSDYNMGEVRAAFSAYAPLPVLKRHSLYFSLRVHALPGAPTGLMQVGGFAHGSYEYSSVPSSGEGRGSNIPLPSGIGFSESLRGFEDYPIHTTHTAIADARYRYPFIIDKGWASTLYLFPSLFVRQVDLEAFGTAAYTSDSPSPLHRALGGAANLRLTFGQAVPVTLYYQYASRIDDNLRPLHLFGIAID